MKEGFLPRTCEALAVGKMKECILKSSSKKCVGQAGDEGLGIIITLVDIVAFFDRKDIRDVMQTLYRIGVNQKAARVWFKLNSKTEIAVKTASGITETEMVDDCIGQGTAGAALVSQVILIRDLWTISRTARKRSGTEVFGFSH